ncbi:hypothetical protein [Streptomyces sp. NPDC050485]|uniref:hypothetical protein n=1 Tax=Streptomyces sp. NPDC050485 TaxID=3365617 RepID=UPI0037B39478
MRNQSRSSQDAVIAEAAVTKAERRHLAVASASLGPWGAATTVGAVGGFVSLTIDSIADGFGTMAIAGAGSVALLLFFLVGGVGAALGGVRADRTDRTDRTDHRIRLWARAHPWRVAAVPAGLMVLGDVVVRQAVTSEAFSSSVWDGVWRGFAVAGVVGLVGIAGKARMVGRR